MAHSTEQTNTSESNAWFSIWSFIRFFNWASAWISTTTTWLFPEKMKYTEDESGEYLRRAMAKRSLFDSISMAWVELPIYAKLLLVTGTSLVAGIIGLWVSAPVLLALTAFTICIGLHLMFVAQEHQRRKFAKTMAQEAVELNQELNAQKKQRDELLELLQKKVDMAEQMEEQIEAIDKETQEIKQITDDIREQVTQVTATTTQLIAVEDELRAELGETSIQLKKVNKTLDETAQLGGQMNQATTALVESVHGIVESQKKYTEAVTRFGLFVEKQMKEENQPSTPNVHDDFFLELARELEEDETLIEQIKRDRAGVMN